MRDVDQGDRVGIAEQLAGIGEAGKAGIANYGPPAIARDIDSIRCDTGRHALPFGRHLVAVDVKDNQPLLIAQSYQRRFAIMGERDAGEPLLAELERLFEGHGAAVDPEHGNAAAKGRGKQEPAVRADRQTLWMAAELDPLDNPGGVRLEIDDLKEGAEHHFFLAAIVTIGGGDNGEMPVRRDCHGLGRAGDRMLHLDRGYHYRWELGGVQHGERVWPRVLG